MKYCCKYPQKIEAVSIATASGITTVTLPSTFTPEAGSVYDIYLSKQIPALVDGTRISLTNGTVDGTVMAPNGNYYRAFPFTSRSVLRVQYFDDPSHYQILGSRRNVCEN